MIKSLIAVFLLFAAMSSALWVEGSRLTASVNHTVGRAPADLGAEDVKFNGVRGWFVAAGGEQRCVLLLHGVRSDRTSMVARARFLKKSGFASLLIDLQAHGETQGEKITFGFRESENARAAVAYLRSVRGCKKIAAIGVSLGGAASLLGNAPLAVDALILESVYSTIETAVTNRLAIRLGGLAPWAAPLFIHQIPYRLGVPLAALQPLDAIKKSHAPVLVIGGSADRHTQLEETQRLFNNAAKPKELWIIQDAIHQDFYKFAGALYEQKVLAFLHKHL